MIIKISQTASNIKQAYDIDCDGGYYHGNAGTFSRFQPVTLYNSENTLKGVFKLSNLINYIPFRWLFGKANTSRFFKIYKNNDYYGNMAYLHHGFMKRCYEIKLKSGEIFYCYTRSIKSFDYLSIYKGDCQIALLETYLNVNNYKYNHKLYLLDEYKHFSDILCLFALYYSSFNFSRRLHMTVGSSTYQSTLWAPSKYNDKYHPEWRETHFPNENFFGKTNLFSD